MNTRRQLPVIQPDGPLVARRLFLLAGAAAAAGCIPGGTLFTLPGDASAPPDGAESPDAAAPDAPDAVDAVLPADAAACPPGRNWIDAGAVGDTPIGTARIVDDRTQWRSMLFRDAAGAWVVSLRCPHFGGQVVLSGDRGSLRCTQQPASDHGSIFATSGEKISGPPPQAPQEPWLVNYPVQVCNDRIYFLADYNRRVALGTRTPMPT